MLSLSREDAFCVFNALPRVGWVTVQKLLNHFQQNPIAALEAPEAELQKIDITAAARQSIFHWSAHFHLEKEQHHLAQIGASFISFEHPNYPPLLKTIDDPPIGLYVVGALPSTTQTIAIVGSRYADAYGLQIAERFGSTLADHHWCIVSGFARGVDAAAHRGALRVKGQTIAVLGCGIDYIYPPENADLYHQLKQQGCLISEFPLGWRADRMTFPRRNRILSGMSQATVVVQSGIRGGSMLTAAFANEQNRTVFAVPGAVDSPMSAGCHHLIRNGATLVSTPEDILEDLEAGPPVQLQLDIGTQMQRVRQAKPDALEGLERTIYELLQAKGPLGSSTICTMCAQTAEAVQTALFSLEFNHWIARRNDGLFEV